jgi:MFS family permease
VLGFWTIFYGIALIIAPLLGGHIADVTGSFTHSFLVAAVAGGLGAFFFSRIKRPVEGRKN